MEGFGLLASPTKRELSEKELEAESALLMLLSRSDDASRPVETGMHRINHYGARFSAFGAASSGEPNATSTSAPSLEEEVRGRYRTADATATSTFSSPPQPTAEHHQAPRTRVSIYSLLNDDDDDEVRPATRGGNDTDFLFASTPASSSSSRSTPTSPVLSSRPPPESLVSAGRAARSPPMPRTSSDVEVRSSGRSRSKSAGGRKLLSSSSPSVAQKPAGGGRKRKATNKSATAAAAAGTGATTSTPSTAGLKYDRRTKKQRQLELLQSVNSGRSVVLSDSLGAEDIAATLASSPLLAFSSSFLPSMLATRMRERTTAPTAAEDEEQPHHLPSMEVVNGDDATAPRAGGSMLPPAPLASYLSAMSSPLPAGAGSPLPLPSSLAQLQQLLPSPLPAGIDQQRVQQLKSQLMPQQQQAPSSPTGSSTNTTSGGGGSVSSPGANVQSMTNYLNLNLNINSHHTSRFGDKKRERRDSFSFTYPTRNGDHQHQQQHHQTVHGPAAAPPSAPLPQHQQEFLQQLLQQIHKKQTVGMPTLPDASPREAVVAAPSADSSVSADAGPTSPSLVRFYQRPPHTILPSLGGALPLPAEADVSVAETSDVPHTEVVRSEEDAPLQPMDEQQPPEAEQAHAETDGDEVAVEVEVEIESEPMDVAVQVETALESESGNNSDNQDTTISSVSNSQESASGAESSTNEMQTDDFECEQRPPPAEVLECGPQEGRTGSIESHQPADGNNSAAGGGGGGINILVEGEGGLDDPSSSFQGAMSADDVFAGRRKKASPQQMAILEQIWSTTGFRGAFRASTALDFTSSFPSLSSVSASSRNRSSSGSAGASPQLSSSSSSSSSSPAAVADALLSSSRPSPVLLASSSPTLSFAISSPNLPTFLASSSSLGHPTRSEPVFHAAGRREDRDDDEREDAGGLTIEDDDDDEEEEPNEREVEALVIASVPCTTLPHLQRSSAILLPSSSSSTYSSPASLSSSLSATYDRATMERSQPGGSAESASSSSSSSSSPPAVSGEGDDQSRPAPTTAGSDADRCLGSGLGFGAHGSCENGSVGA